MGCSNSNAPINLPPSSPSSDDVLRLLETPTFEPLPLPPIPSPPPSSHLFLPPNDIRPGELPDPLEDLPLWDFYGEGGTLDDQGSADEDDDDFFGIDEGDENGGTVVEQIPYMASNEDQFMDCSGCHILREVTHSNGVLCAKIEIHGGMGIVYHAITMRYTGDGIILEQHFADLSTQSLESVKQYLIEYSQSQQREGLFLTWDSLSTFYDAISVRMNDGEASTSTNGSLVPPDPQQNTGRTPQVVAVPKTGIAAQRERAANLHLTDLADYFHLPISEAARELSLCTTALKKICRRSELSRWPHRKLKSLLRKISKLENIQRTQTGAAAERTSDEIDKLRETMTRVSEGTQG